MKAQLKKFAALVCVLLLAGVMAAGCSAQDNAGGTSTAGGTEQASAIDVSSLKTLGDVVALSEEPPTLSWNDSYLVCVVRPEGGMVRAVAKATSETNDAIAGLDIGSDDYNAKFTKALGSYPLESVEDISNMILSQDELDKLVGKTGQELYDSGFVFSSYSMYGGETTGATLDNGYCSYDIEFDVQVPEDKTEDEGAALKEAPVLSAQFTGPSNQALDLELVGASK